MNILDYIKLMSFSTSKKIVTRIQSLPTESEKLFIQSISGDPGKEAINQNVTLFYINKFGSYPYIESKIERNGGVPQKGNLTAHLEKVKQDVQKYLQKDQLGLSIIDWPNWKPLWIRNMGSRTIYMNKSIELAKQNYPNLTIEEVTKLAKEDFENAGKTYMLKTLELARSLRPKNYWGFYGFPDCFNNNYNDINYNGSCLQPEIERNDLLNWLWNGSTALFPSVYLYIKLKSSIKAALYTRNRVREALRVSKVRNPQDPLPVFVYVRSIFVDKPAIFLSEVDLVHTIGESFALGVSGVVLLETAYITKYKEFCRDLQQELLKTLGHYLVNVTLASIMCTHVLCKNQGYCVRKDWNSSDYLHLNPNNFEIKFSYCNKFIVFGEPSVQDLKKFSEKFECACFSKKNCEKNEKVETTRHVRICVTENICISALVNPGSSVIPYEETSETLIPSSTSATSTESNTGSTYSSQQTPTIPRNNDTAAIFEQEIPFQ
ncbi:hyaluronidase PH-20-like [Suncus etruscus]|uniref:hyaluronidase PH-20-like n=1 Tax=Suncus etruscus TaxID=109475 RepID=UPI00210FEE6A|nr:hyaluronidase PH-20-like [Suncus etruscus]